MNFSNIAENLGFDGIVETKTEIYGNRKIFIDGILGINEYADDILKANLLKGEIIVYGTNLEIVNMEEKSITVAGKISSVEFFGGAIK